MVVGPGQVSVPDNVSPQVKVIITSVLFHPCPFGTGLAVAVIVGAVLSILTVALVVAVLPALSVVEPVKV